MKVILPILLASSFSFAAKKWGGEITLKSMPIAMTDAIKSPAKGEMLVKGKVDKVCTKKGCWMAFKAGKENVRVTFKDYGFFVPKTLKNKEIVAQGLLSVKTLSVKDARHYAEDAGKSKAEIAKITEPQKEFSFVASAVRLN